MGQSGKLLRLSIPRVAPPNFSRVAHEHALVDQSILIVAGHHHLHVQVGQVAQISRFGLAETRADLLPC